MPQVANMMNQPPMPQAAPMGQQAQQPMNMMPQQHVTISQQYTAVTAPLLPLIEAGKNYKQRVGETIFKYIQQLAP